MKSSLVSIIITNHNGYSFLRDCLDSVFSQTWKNIEVILVDNNSSDDSVSFVKKNYPQVRVIAAKKNYGFAQGNNLGYLQSKGDFILLLNNDTHFDKSFLKSLLAAFNHNPKIGIVQPMIKLAKEKEKLDSCGSYLTNTGFLYHVGNYKLAKLPKYNKPFAVYSVKGVAMLVKREVIEKVGLFDRDFWCYFEESDFCGRSWIAGYESWYWPEAVIFHHLGGTRLKKDESFVQFHSYKNRLRSYLKNLDLLSLFVILPVYLMMCFCWSILYLISGQASMFFALNRATLWNIAYWNKTLNLRKKVQSLRKVTDSDIFKVVKKNPNVSYYLCLVKGLANYED